MADQAGLQELEERRRRKRQVPKPQHAKAIVSPGEPAAEARTTPATHDEEPAPPAPAEVVPKAVATTTPGPEAAASLPLRRRTRLRQTQVHLDDRADSHLTELKKRAVMGEVDLSASGVLRRALEEYVERHGYDGIVAWFAEHGR